MNSQISLPRPPRRSAADWNTWLTDRGPNDADGGFGTSAPGGSREPSPMFDPALDNGQQELGEREIRDGAAGSASGQHIQVDQDRLSVAAAEICRLLKRKKNLSAESEAELDTYVSTRDISAALALVLSAILEVRDMVRATNKPSTWTIPEGLKDNLRNFANAFLLCHNVSSYRGKVANKLIDALRELNIQGMPAEKETAQVKKVRQDLGNYLTQARHSIKDHIKDSVDNSDSGKENVADLAVAVIGRTGIKPTVQLYMRLAFLRWMYEDNADVKDEDWWVLVDQQLDDWRTKARNERDLSEIFHGIYKDDIARFGDPADSSESAIEASAVPSLQVVLQAHAKDIVGGKKKTIIGGGKKRKADALDDD